MNSAGNSSPENEVKLESVLPVQIKDTYTEVNPLPQKHHTQEYPQYSAPIAQAFVVGALLVATAVSFIPLSKKNK